MNDRDKEIEQLNLHHQEIYTNFEAQIKQLQEENELLEKQKEGLTEKVKILEQLAESKAEKEYSESPEYISQLNELAEENKNLKVKCEELKRKLEESQQEKASLTRRTPEVNKSEGLNLEIKNLQSRCESLMQENKKLVSVQF